MITSLAERFRDLKVQVFKQLESERRRESQEIFHVAKYHKGMSRYLDGREILGIPKIRDMCH